MPEVRRLPAEEVHFSVRERQLIRWDLYHLKGKPRQEQKEAIREAARLEAWKKREARDEKLRQEEEEYRLREEALATVPADPMEENWDSDENTDWPPVAPIKPNGASSNTDKSNTPQKNTLPSKPLMNPFFKNTTQQSHNPFFKNVNTAQQNQNPPQSIPPLMEMKIQPPLNINFCQNCGAGLREMLQNMIGVKFCPYCTFPLR